MKPTSLLPPHRTPRNMSKYLIIPPDLYHELEVEAARRGYKVREFALEILRRAIASR